MFRKLLLPDYLLFTAILLTCLLSLIRCNNSNGENYSTAIISDSSFVSTAINDSLPYYKYRLIKDSTERIEQCKKLMLSAKGTGMYGTFPGFTHIRERDDCGRGRESVQQDKYYLVLPGYRLKPSVDFYIDNGNYYLKYVIWDEKNNDTWKGHMGYKKIPVRYNFSSAYLADPDNHEVTGNVMVPVSKKDHRVVRFLTYAAMIALGVYGFFILLVLPLRILHAIAKGVMFNPVTIRHLLIIGWSLVALAILPAVIAFLFHFIFRNQIPDEIYLPFLETCLQSQGQLLAGLVVLLLARAFQKGYLVQEDSDLSI